MIDLNKSFEACPICQGPLMFIPMRVDTLQPHMKTCKREAHFSSFNGWDFYNQVIKYEGFSIERDYDGEKIDFKKDDKILFSRDGHVVEDEDLEQLEKLRLL